MTYARKLFVADGLLSAVEPNQIVENTEQVRTQHKGPSAPPEAVPGTLWLDDSLTPWTWEIYDGNAWSVFAIVSPDELVAAGVNEEFGTGSATNIESTLFDVSSQITENNWESVGPTGSGADNIWIALDSLLLSAQWAEIRATATAIISSSAAEGVLYVRPLGSISVKQESTIVLAIRNQASTLSQSGMLSTTSSFHVPLDSSNRFEMTWEGVGATTFFCSCYLAGYGYNR